MEQQEVQAEEGISLVGIFKLFLRHIKLLIISVLIACVVGGGFGVLTSYDVHYFGTTAKFYVNPKKDDESSDSVYGTYSVAVMDGIVRLLNSESFSEQLLLNGEPLPKKDFWADNAAQNAELNALIDAAQKEVDHLEEVEKTIDEKTEEKADASLALTEKNKALTTANTELSEAYTSLDSEWQRLRANNSTITAAGQIHSDIFTTANFNEDVYLNLDKDDSPHKDKISDTLRERYATWREKKDLQETATAEKEAAQETVDILTLAINDLEKNLKPIKETTNEEVAKAIALWRTTKKYKEALSKYNAAAKFSFLEDDSQISTVDRLARSFIIVDVSVLNEESFAKDLFEAIKLVVPTYVESNMPKPSGYTDTNCHRITINDDIQETNPDYMVTQALKFAALAALITLVVVCVVVVLVDKSNKRLRNIDVISKKFNLPVLGVIPNLGGLDESSDFNDKTKTKKA